jgi:hypothetical protein
MQVRLSRSLWRRRLDASASTPPQYTATPTTVTLVTTTSSGTFEMVFTHR